MKEQIKLFDPVIGKNEENGLKKVLKSHFWASGSGIGNVSKFEQEFKKYVNSNECLAVNSGTAALHLALSIPGIKGKEVIIPSLSFVATAHAIIYNGGKPIFADIDPETMCIDPESVKEKITSETKVVVPVHFAGMVSKLDEIHKICKNNNCEIIEDAAHASGSTFKEKKIGSHSLAVCFSYHPVKNLAMPTGGSITLNGNKSKRIKKILSSRRWCGISNRKNWSYDVSDIGWNYYMNEFSAVIGRIQLKNLDRLNKRRNQIVKRYSKEIEVNKKMPYNKECSYHFYWILVKNRNQFMTKLKNEGIETGIHYKPIHQMTYYKKKIKLPKTENIASKIVSLPTHPNLTDTNVSKIIKYVNRYS